MSSEADDCNITLADLTAYPHGSYLNVAALSFIFVLGVTGNGSIIWLFFKESKLRDINNAFIINLAFSDLLLLLWFVPSAIFENFLYYRPFGLPFCYILTIVTYTSHDVSIFSLVVLSYIRYRAVVHPLDNYTKHRTSRTILTCIVIWVISISTSIFLATQCNEICIKDFIRVHILWIPQEVLIYHTVRCAVLYILPLSLLCILYSVMAFKLIPGGTMLQRNNSASARKAMRSRHRLGFIVIALIVIFAVAWLPRYVQIILGLFDIYSTPLNILTDIFMVAGSSLNPYALYAASTMFRLYFRKYILVCTSGTQSLESTNVTMSSLKNSLYRSSNGSHFYRSSKIVVTFQEKLSG